MLSKTNCNIVMPMSGFGKRFKEVGFTIPKPFIDIFGALMFRVAFDSLGFSDANNIFIASNAHKEFRDIESYVKEFIPNGKVIFEGKPIVGQAYSAYQAKSFINNNNPLIICNC